MGTATNSCLIQTGQKEETFLANVYATLFTQGAYGYGYCNHSKASTAMPAWNDHKGFPRTTVGYLKNIIFKA